MENIQKFSLLNHTSKLHVLSLLSLALDSRRLDRPARQRRDDVSPLAQPTHARTAATVEISWETRPRVAGLPRQTVGFCMHCEAVRSAILATAWLLITRATLAVAAILTCLSVRPSVCHAPVLCQNEESYRHDFFTIVGVLTVATCWSSTVVARDKTLNGSVASMSAKQTG